MTRRIIEKKNWLNDVTVTGGIHTFEVKVTTCQIPKGQLPYLRTSPLKRNGAWEIQINPHKTDKNADGRYRCLYGDGEKIVDTTERIRREMQWSKDWRFSRIDYCFDMDAQYEQAAKLTRLFLLLIAHEKKLENRYYSTDPLTLEIKSTSVKTASKNAPAVYDIEHYNRSLLDQSDFDRIITNRLEFRMGGNAILHKQNAGASVEQWFEIFDQALTPKNLQAVEDAQAQAVFDQWQRTGVQRGMKQLSSFLRANDNLVYTRQQLAAVYRLNNAQDAREAARNFIRRGGVELYTLDDLRAYAKVLREAYDSDQCFI